MSILETERDLLGAALTDPRVSASVKLTAAQFEDDRHGAIWEAITELHQERKRPDPVTIVQIAKARVDHAMVVDLVGRGLSANAETYAGIIRDTATRRDLAVNLTRAKAMLDTDIPVDEITAGLFRGLNVESGSEKQIEASLTLDEFVDQNIPDEEWVIPGLLAEGDRMILTGAEGAGKTTLLRQMAVCAAAGVHPFTYLDMPPKRVLVVDVENPQRIMMNRFRELRDAVRSRGKSTADRLWISRLPQGMDLGRASDRLHLQALCRMFDPDLLVIGPAYKLYVGGSASKDEDLARQVTSTLDSLREEFGFSLLLEHHPGHGAMGQKRSTRPFGSSLWQRWPEFGIGIRLAEGASLDHRLVDVEHWRGPRDERPWPDQLDSGGTLPWVDADPFRTHRKAAGG